MPPLALTQSSRASTWASGSPASAVWKPVSSATASRSTPTNTTLTLSSVTPGPDALGVAETAPPVARSPTTAPGITVPQPASASASARHDECRRAAAATGRAHDGPCGWLASCSGIGSPSLGSGEEYTILSLGGTLLTIASLEPPVDRLRIDDGVGLVAAGSGALGTRALPRTHPLRSAAAPRVSQRSTAARSTTAAPAPTAGAPGGRSGWAWISWHGAPPASSAARSRASSLASRPCWSTRDRLAARGLTRKPPSASTYTTSGRA